MAAETYEFSFKHYQQYLDLTFHHLPTVDELKAAVVANADKLKLSATDGISFLGLGNAGEFIVPYAATFHKANLDLIYSLERDRALQQYVARLKPHLQIKSS